ncbi:MAG: peptidylprolyl isomerase [Neisseriaceae bacterium]
MFDFFRNSNLVKVFLALIALSFLYFGFNGISFVKSPYVVKIGKTKITNFDVKNYLQRMRQPQDETNIDRAYIFLQKRAYFIEGGRKIGLTIPGRQVGKIIESEPAFREFDGRFNPEKYRNFIATTYRSEALFEDELRKNMIFSLIDYYLTNYHIISNYQLLQYLAVYETQKEIQSLEFPREAYQDKVRYSDVDLQAFYQAHKSAYRQDKAIQFEYLQLTPEWLVQQMKVSEEEKRRYYESNRASQPRRMVSHIVFAFPKDKAADQNLRATLRTQAQGILQRLKQEPEKFSQYAQQYSQDRSTAQFGGSLGLIEKNGQYYSAIENAAFDMKQTGIYNQLVEAEDGYHILRVEAILNWKNYQLDRAGIDYVLRFNRVKNHLASLRDQISEASFSESKNLRKISQTLLGSDIVKTNKGWITKQEAFSQGWPAEVIRVLFDPMTISSQDNSDVITVGNSVWVVRVTQVRPSRELNYVESKERVIKDYVNMKSGELALSHAKEVLLQLQAGQSLSLAWSPVRTVSIEEAQKSLPQEEYYHFLRIRPDPQGRPVYYLLEKRAHPVIMRVNAEKLNYPFDQEKIKLSFSKANDIAKKKNEIATLSYLRHLVGREAGNANLEH